MTVLGMAHVGVMTCDLDAMVEFYEQKLGFEAVWSCDDGTERICFIRTENGFLELFEERTPPATLSKPRVKSESGLLHLALYVDDIRAEHQRLAAAGVPFTVEPQELEQVAFCFCEDPEGNTIELMQFKDPDLPLHPQRTRERSIGHGATDATAVRRAGDTLRRAIEG
jgi:catechol 2,3-dioxygenase-like lactoylglutathione lyase family enzyme